MARLRIDAALKHKGALHRSLGVPAGQPIPTGKIKKAAASSNPTLARRARFALLLAKLRPKKGLRKNK